MWNGLTRNSLVSELMQCFIHLSNQDAPQLRMGLSPDKATVS